MASITKEITVSVPAALAWSRIRDFGAVQHLVPGFLIDCRLDEDARIVTFKNGRAARELLVDIDDEAQRLVYAEPTEPFITRNAALQVFADGEGRCRIVWIIDVLPNAYAVPMRDSMEEALGIMRRTLESADQQESEP